MKTTFITGLTAIVISLSCAVQHVQAQNPQVADALSKILALQGKWEGPATLVLNGETFHFPYKFNFKKTAGGNGLYMDETFTHPAIGTVLGANLIGYNANDEKIHWLSVDNLGTCHEHLGTWLDSDHFYMEAHETIGGQVFLEKIDIIMNGNNKMEITLEALLDGQTFETLTGTFQRIEKGK